jgi:hypothetical protein
MENYNSKTNESKGNDKMEKEEMGFHAKKILGDDRTKVLYRAIQW